MNNATSFKMFVGMTASLATENVAENPRGFIEKYNSVFRAIVGYYNVGGDSEEWSSECHVLLQYMSELKELKTLEFRMHKYTLELEDSEEARGLLRQYGNICLEMQLLEVL